MNIQIDPLSEVPICQQLYEQIILLIGTGQLTIGQLMPSVRKLAPQLNVHRNTVGSVYADLVRAGWLLRRGGSRLVVVRRNGPTRNFVDHDNLDDLIKSSILKASELGYSAEEFAAGVQDYLRSQRSERWFAIGPDLQLAELISEEIRRATGQHSQACSIEPLFRSPELFTGAVLIAPHPLVDEIEDMPTSCKKLLSVFYTRLDNYLAQIRGLAEPSVIGVLSTSPTFLRTVRGVLGAAIGERHTLKMLLLENSKSHKPSHLDNTRKLAEAKVALRVRNWAGPDVIRNVKNVRVSIETGDDSPLLLSSELKGIDLLFCDSICQRLVMHPRSVHFPVISAESLEAIRSQIRTG
jgi:DNA-binding transcriptional regulator YhcF (GntR family)